MGELGGTSDAGSAALTGTLHAFHTTGIEIEPTEVGGEDFALRVSGRYVPVGDRLAPEVVELDLYGDAGRPTCSARVEVRHGVPRVVEVRFVSRPGEGEVRQAHLRETQVEALLDLVAAYTLRVIDQGDGTGVVEMGVDSDANVSSESLDTLRTARVNRKVTPEFLREVAAMYTANIGTAPTKAVKDRFFVGERMASKYVQLAREAGLLPPTSPGRKKA